MVVCLNVSTQLHYWLGVDSERLEYLVKVAATLVYQGIQDGYSVGLLSNGCLAHSDQPFHIPPCLLYTSDAADERSSVDLGGRRIIKKKKKKDKRRG